MLAVWRRDPVTGGWVHEECISGIVVRYGPRGTVREAPLVPDPTLPKPE